MVNKKIKKKTKWHPLSLTGQDDEKKLDDANKSRVPFKMEWKINHNAGENAPPHYRNNSNNSSTTTTTTPSSHHNNNHHRFDKRASSNKIYSKSHHGNHHHNGYSTTTTGGNSYNKFGKHEHLKDFPKKVQFNEGIYEILSYCFKNLHHIIFQMNTHALQLQDKTYFLRKATYHVRKLNR